MTDTPTPEVVRALPVVGYFTVDRRFGHELLRFEYGPPEQEGAIRLVCLSDATARIAALERSLQDMALEVLSSSGQAAEAHERQLAAERERDAAMADAQRWRITRDTLPQGTFFDCDVSDAASWDAAADAAIAQQKGVK